MPRNALSNPITLTALGALLEQPMHPYQLATTLHERGVPVNRGSLYDTLEAMHKVGWVKAGEPEQIGNRPVHTIYTLTIDGQTELANRLDMQLRTLHSEFSEFMGAVAHIGVLGKKRVLAALGERLERLEARIAEVKQKYTEAMANGAPRLFIIEAEYALALMTAERTWVDQIVQEINNGKLSWPQARQYHKERLNDTN